MIPLDIMMSAHKEVSILDIYSYTLIKVNIFHVTQPTRGIYKTMKYCTDLYIKTYFR